jgi:hypothetical protein
VVVVPIPETVIPPGFLVNVQVPVDGNPFIPTLPVDNIHVGCVTVTITGAGGFKSDNGTIASFDRVEMHPSALVTEKLYVPGLRPETVVLMPVPDIETLPG